MAAGHVIPVPRPKVAIVIGRMGRGGVERQILEFVSAAHPDRANCLVVCLTEPGPLAPQVRATGAPVISLRMSKLSVPLGLVRLISVLRRERPDAVVAHLFFGYALTLPITRLALPSAARIVAAGSLPAFDVPRQRYLRPLKAWALRFANAVVANSHAVARAWEEAHPSLTGRIHVVPYGVRQIEPRTHRVDDDRLTMVCVANLISYKGHRVLLSALAELHDAGREFVAQLVGDGPERQALEQLVSARQLEGCVYLLGQRDDVDELLAGADLLVLSSFTEGLPNAVLEGMTHGLPIVATDVGAVRELLDEGAGLIVPPGDPLALAAALERMLDDPELREKAGAIGFGVARSDYSIERMRDEMLETIQKLRPSGPTGR